MLKDGTTTDLKGIMKIMGIGKTQFYDSVNELIKQDYIDKIDSKITFKENPKSIVLRDVASTYNIEILLNDSTEIVFSNLIEPVTIEEIQHFTNLSRPTIERSISELQSIGSIRKETV